MRAARLRLVERDGHCILCDEPGDDPHHRLPQSAGGALADPTLAALSRLVLLCRRHHDWVESYRTFAEFLGLIVRHGITAPADVPLFHHRRWVLIDDAGGVTPCLPPIISIAHRGRMAEFARTVSEFSGALDV